MLCPWNPESVNFLVLFAAKPISANFKANFSDEESDHDWFDLQVVVLCSR